MAYVHTHSNAPIAPLDITPFPDTPWVNHTRVKKTQLHKRRKESYNDYNRKVREKNRKGTGNCSS